MERVTARIREVFEAPEAAVYLVATGTAANALALACLCPPWATVYCHRNAHVEEDECGAPEFYTGGAKLTLLDGEHGAHRPGEPASGRSALTANAGVHNVQKGALSLTNATEAGTVYAPGAGGRAGRHCAGHGIPVHMDGARFANAVAQLGCTPAELTWKAGVDVLSFGGTKNGCLGVEAVVLFDPARAWEFELRRKRGGHLFSKHRFLSAQMEAYLEGDLWLDLAEAANARARELARRDRGPARRGAGAPDRGERRLRRLARGPGTGRRWRRGRTTISGRPTRAWRARTTSRCRRGWSATGRRPRPKWRSSWRC